MSTLLLFFFRLLIISAPVVLLVGLFKPEWLRWRSKQPAPLMTFVLAAGLFMAGFTGASKTYFSADEEVVEAAKEDVIPAAADYTDRLAAADCQPGSKPGPAGASDEEETDDGIRFSVRTPTNYKDTVAHPLLVVYAPAGRDREETEAFTHLTREAAAAGFIVAYADHRRLSPEEAVRLAQLPKAVEEKWCIDSKRVFLTGHSDGGTTTMAIAFFNGTKHIPAAIAPSAVGIRGDDLADRNCVKPIPVMMMHSRRDKLFPNYGKEAIEWWANCNKCATKKYNLEDRKALSGKPMRWESYYRHELEQKAKDLKIGQPLPNTIPVQGVEGCVAYSGCKDGVQTWYCEGSGPHPEWPGRNKAMIEFFKAVKTDP
jgi:polyhydroxybutyrate depolymerase